MDKRIVTVDYFKTEGNIFIKGLVFYVLELDFDVSDYLELSEKKVFFFEELFEQKIFEAMLKFEISPVAEKDDFLDSIFFWQYYEGVVDPIEYLVLKMIMCVRLFVETIGLINDIIDQVKLSYDDTTNRNVFKIIHDNMVKTLLKISRTIKKNNFLSFFGRFSKTNVYSMRYLKDQIAQCLQKLKKISEETVFLSAIMYYANRENCDIQTSRVMTSVLVSKVEPQKIKYHKENLESIDLLLRQLLTH